MFPLHFFFTQRRTHSQLFLHLIEDIANTMDDVDYPVKGFVRPEQYLIHVVLLQDTYMQLL